MKVNGLNLIFVICLLSSSKSMAQCDCSALQDYIKDRKYSSLDSCLNSGYNPDCYETILTYGPHDQKQEYVGQQKTYKCQVPLLYTSMKLRLPSFVSLLKKYKGSDQCKKCFWVKAKYKQIDYFDISKYQLNEQLSGIEKFERLKWSSLYDKYKPWQKDSLLVLLEMHNSLGLVTLDSMYSLGHLFVDLMERGYENKESYDSLIVLIENHGAHIVLPSQRFYNGRYPAQAALSIALQLGLKKVIEYLVDFQGAKLEPQVLPSGSITFFNSHSGIIKYDTYDDVKEFDLMLYIIDVKGLDEKFVRSHYYFEHSDWKQARKEYRNIIRKNEPSKRELCRLYFMYKYNLDKSMKPNQRKRFYHEFINIQKILISLKPDHLKHQWDSYWMNE